MIEFDAKILPAERGGAWVEIPFSAQETFGTRGQVKVRATFDGAPYRGSIAPTGGRHVLGVVKAVRKKIGKDVGDTVRVTLKRDTEQRAVEVQPPELERALHGHPKARAFFDTLAYTYRKEYACWINSAQRAETKRRRLATAIEMLARGEKL